MPVDVVLPAGGRIEGTFARETGVSIKALLSCGAATLLTRTVGVLRASPAVGRIVVVGPPDLAADPGGQAADALLPDQGDGAPNTLHGLEWLRARGADRVLVAAADLPFLDAAAIHWFLARAPAEAELVAPVVRRQAFERRFPASTNEYLGLRDGEWTLGCLFLVCPTALNRSRLHLERAFAARKSQLAMARLLGPRFVARFLLRRLTVEAIRGRCAELLECRAAVLPDAPPELAYDLDLPAHYRYVLHSGDTPRP